MGEVYPSFSASNRLTVVVVMPMNKFPCINPTALRVRHDRTNNLYLVGSSPKERQRNVASKLLSKAMLMRHSETFWDGEEALDDSTSGGSPTKQRSLGETLCPFKDLLNDHFSEIRDESKVPTRIFFIELKNGVFDFNGIAKDELSPTPDELKSRMSQVVLTNQSILYFLTIHFRCYEGLWILRNLGSGKLWSSTYGNR